MTQDIPKSGNRQQHQVVLSRHRRGRWSGNRNRAERASPGGARLSEQHRLTEEDKCIRVMCGGHNSRVHVCCEKKERKKGRVWDGEGGVLVDKYRLHYQVSVKEKMVSSSGWNMPVQPQGTSAPKATKHSHNTHTHSKHDFQQRANVRRISQRKRNLSFSLAFSHTLAQFYLSARDARPLLKLVSTCVFAGRRSRSQPASESL